jgi:hypothetical protein
MLVRPTTDAVLRGLLEELKAQIGPELQTETAKVAFGMITQLLQGCAVRAGHEIAWMHDEMASIADALAGVSSPNLEAARAALAAGPTGLELVDVATRYDLASRVLSAGLEHAYSSGDSALAERLRQLLEARSAREMQIVGALDLVGRG